jgi:hypothetical protein
MDLEEKRRKRVKRYTRVELRRKEEKRSGRELVRGTRCEVGPKMKRKETIPCGIKKECDVLERSTDEDRPTKRHGIEDRVSSGDTNSSSSRSSGSRKRVLVGEV